jgi:Sulfotransferase domain
LRSLTSLSAFPKSGVTYLSFLLFYSLFPDECDIHDIERKYVLDIHAYPDATFADPKGPRLIKSHLPYVPWMPVISATQKAVYLIRHPIDVMASAWDFENLTSGGARQEGSPEFRAFVRRWLETGGDAFPGCGTWVQHVRSWLSQTDIPVHLVRYEDLVDDRKSALVALLAFLQLSVPADRVRRAIEKSSMKAMAKLEEEEVTGRREGVFFRNSLASGYGLGHRFINKGYRGSYERLLSEEERVLCDRTFGPELARYFAGRG